MNNKIIIFTFNTNSIGGPTKSMRLISSSFLNQKYEFIELSINQRLGIFPKIKILLQLSRKIRGINPSIIHISGLQLHGFYATLASKLSGKGKILLVVRGSSSEVIRFNPIKRFLLTRILEPLTIKMADSIYSVSKNMAEKNSCLIRSKKYIGSIPNAAPNIKNTIKFNLRSKYSLEKDDFLLIYTGRVVEDKGISYALEAIKMISNDKIKLIICGEGKDSEYYKIKYSSLIENKRVFFIGNQQNVLSILMDTDAFLFPTLHENLSNSLLEAGAVGLPIIATNVGGNSEIIDDGVDGLLVKARDAKDIYEKILLLYNDKIFSEIISKRITSKIEKKFSQEVILNKLQHVYESLTENTNL